MAGYVDELVEPTDTRARLAGALAALGGGALAPAVVRL
jgi:hypothetical protein